MPNDNSQKPSDDTVNSDAATNSTDASTRTSDQMDSHADTVLNAQKTPSYAPSPNSVISSPQAPKKYGGRKAIITMFALLLLVLGGISSLILVQRQALVPSQAWDCSKYIFSVSQTGTVTIQNGSSVNEPAQKADVYINNTKVKTFDVPALAKGTGATLGTVTVPSGQGFTWKVDASGDCDRSGKYDGANEAAATCSEVKAYDTNWKLLSADDLKKVTAGTIIRFAVSGTASSGAFDKARFTINGTLRDEVSNKKPGSEEFYDEYTVPANTTDFTITAQVHHTSLGWF
jgi:hypothetical protein